MFSFLRFPSRRFFSVLLSPLALAGSLAGRLGSLPSGGWSCASSVSHFPNDGLHVSFPFGPVTVVGLSFRQRLMLWSDLVPQNYYALHDAQDDQKCKVQADRSQQLANHLQLPSSAEDHSFSNRVSQTE